MTDTVVITGIARTPMGAFKGAFADVAAPEGKGNDAAETG